MNRNRSLVVGAALFGATCVMLGAFAAHGAGPQAKDLLTTGAHYGLVHALLAIVSAGLASRSRLFPVAGWLALAGGAVFATALGLIGLADLSLMGMVAPIGGLLMILAWLLFALAALQPVTPPAA